MARPCEISIFFAPCQRLGGWQGGRRGRVAGRATRAAGGAHLARRPPLRYANQVEMMGIHPMIKMISTSTGTPNFIQ